MSDSPFDAKDVEDIFISHSHSDKHLVHPVVKALNDSGISTWCSSIDNLISTRNIIHVVDEKLRRSKIVLLFASKNALAEYDENTGDRKFYIAGELIYALKKDKLYSIVISKIDEIPSYIERAPFVDFSDEKPPFSGEKWENFLSALKTGLVVRTKVQPAPQRDKDRADGDKSEPLGVEENPAFAVPVRVSEDIGSLLAANDAVYEPEGNFQRQSVATKKQSLSEKPLAKLAAAIELELEDRDWSLLNLHPLVEKGLAGKDPLAVHKAARAQQIDAQALIGLAHWIGIAPFEPDNAIAGRWLERASEASHARAKAELAVMIASRKFGTFDLEVIDRLTAEASAANCTRAKTYRALLRQTGTRLPTLSFDDSFRLLENAHKQYDWLASTHLGWSLLHGRGVRLDKRRGITMLQDAAQAGEARACSYLGIAHGEGRGVSPDPEKATHWFKRAAQGGDRLGLYQFAWCHEVGYGTARDAGEARRLYKQAAEHGDERAMVRLSQMLLDGRGGVSNPTEAVAFLEQGCAADDDDAKALLAKLFLDGKGVPRNLAKAAELLEDAAQNDQPWALWNLGKLYENGTGVTRDRERAISLYRRAAFSATNADLFYAVLKRLDAMGERLRRPGS